MSKRKLTLSESIAAAMDFNGGGTQDMTGGSTTLPLDDIQSLGASQHAQNTKLSQVPTSGASSSAAAGDAAAAPSASAPAASGASATSNAAMSIINAAKKNAGSSQEAAVSDDEPAEETEEVEEVDSEDEEEKKKTKKMEESLRNVFASAGVDLSETFFTQLSSIFEATVADKVNYRLEKLVPVIEERFNEYANGVTTQLVAETDKYLDYVVEQYLEENKLAIDNGIKLQICENFMSGMKNLFESCYVDVPNEKFDLLGNLYNEAVELENTNKDLIQENINLKNENYQLECASIFIANTRELADTQREQIKNLMENVTFSDTGEFAEKLSAIKTHYLSSTKNSLVENANAEDTFGKVQENKPKNESSIDKDIQRTIRYMNRNA